MTSLDQRGQVITFYSYKGGTGRTMTLANVACLLAQRYTTGKGVLMVDWDLEAPGLHRFFRDRVKISPRARRDSTIDRHPGLIDLFQELDKATQRFNTEPGIESRDLARDLFESVKIERFILETDISSLYLLKAGRFDDDKYAERVNTFQWEALFNRVPWLFRSLALRLAEQYRYVLIDSRTGLSDMSGICTALMPEKLVVVFTPNRQNLGHLRKLIRQATDYRKQSDDLRPLVVFPLPSRIEATEPTLRATWRYGDDQQQIVGYQPLFERVFKEVYGLPECDLGTYFDEVQIQYVPSYAYGEEIAILRERNTDRLSLTRSYESFTTRLVSKTSPWKDEAETTIGEDLEALHRAIELDSNFAPAYLNRGLAYLKLRRNDQALVDFDHAIALNPAFVQAYNNRGLTYAQMKRYDKALADFDHAINLDSTSTSAFLNRALVYLQMGRYDDALSDFNQAIKIDPTNVSAYLNRGAAYAVQKRYDDAIGDYTRALQLDPTRSRAYYNRGMVYENVQLYEAALADYLRAIELEPDFAPALLRAGALHVRLGSLQEGLPYLEKAAQLGDEEGARLAEQVRQQIETASETDAEQPVQEG